MAATNFTPIQLYFSTTASAVPTAANLAQGELAINITDGKVYYEDNSGAVQVIATKGTGTIGGSTTQIQYNNAGALAGSSAMTFNSGTSTTTLTTLNLTNALGATYGGTAQSTYAQGDIVYASAANTLAKLGIGASTFILTSNGTIPQWVAPSSISVLTATNLAGGAAGSVPYQSGVATTTFLAIGAANTVMTSSGTAPQWGTTLTGLTGVSSSSITNTGLTSGRVVFSTTAGLETDSANLTFSGTILTSTGFAGPLNGTVGATTPATGAFTTVTATTAANAANITAINTLTTAQTGNISAVNNASIPINIGVFGSTAGTFGNTSASTAFVSTTASSLAINAQNASGTVNIGVGTTPATVGAFSSTGLAVTGTLSATGVATFSAGSAAAPAITTTGDTNTGIFFPAADTISFSEGGAESMRITSAGDVGIGTTTPDIIGYGAGNTTLGTKASATFVPNIQIGTVGVAAATTTILGDHNFYGLNGGSSVVARSIIRSRLDGAIDATNISFLNYIGGAATERMRLDSSGNLGIGTTSPAYKLDVKGVAAVSSGADSGGYRLLYSGANALSRSWILRNDVNAYGDFTIATSTTQTGSTFTDRLVINNSGNVGIGTTSPLALLSLGSLVAAQKFLLYDAGNFSKYGFGIQTNEFRQFYPSDAVLTFGTISIADGSTFTERARITSGGYFKASNAGTYQGSTGTYHELRQTIDEQIAWFTNTSATLTGTARGLRVSYTAASPNDTANYLLYCDDSTSLRAGFRSNGGLANFSANNTNLSDQRVKTDIQDAGGYLAKICAIPVRTFKYKDQTDELPNLGVIAQEVEAVAPELVDTTGFGETPQDGIPLKAIYQTDLQYALMKCIQEQQALITQLTARITALETP